MSIDRVGIVGYGAMGSAFAERLVGAGFPPVVYDVAPAAVAHAKEAGLEVAASPADLADRCDVIDLIVRTADEVREAVVGEGGILLGAHEGATVVLHPTVLPETTFEMVKALEGRGVRALDSCPTGIPSVVRAGGVVFLTGGDDDLVDAVRPHLLRIGKGVIHLGPLGTGNVGKLVKNLVTASERLVIHEALLIGESMGLGYVQALEMLQATSPGRATVIDRWDLVFKPDGSDVTPHSGTNLFDKDLPLAAELGRHGGLDLPITFALERAGRALVERERGGS